MVVQMNSVLRYVSLVVVTEIPGNVAICMKLHAMIAQHIQCMDKQHTLPYVGVQTRVAYM